MFLQKVYAENKFLFYLFAFFCLGQLFFMYKGVENTPFFLYGMYSAKQSPVEEYTRCIIEIDGQELILGQLTSAKREMIVSSLERYCSLEKSNFQDTILPVISKRFQSRVSEEQYQTIVKRLTNDPSDKVPYRQWLKRYLEYITGEKIGTLKVFTAHFSYSPQFHLAGKELLFEAS